MKIFFITPKLNFISAGGTTSEYDLIYRTLQKLGHEVSVITTSPDRNEIPFDLPYKLIEEEKIPLKRLMTIQKGVFKILKKYEARADIFHIDGQVYLYGAGLYRLLGGLVPVFAYFNRELMSWTENISAFFKKPKDLLARRIKKKLRWLIEKYIGMPIANHIDFFTITTPVLCNKYEEFGLHTANKKLFIGDPYDYKKAMLENNITKKSYIKRNKSSIFCLKSAPHKKQSLRQKVRDKTGKIIIYASGRMVPGKGFDLLLVALAKVKNKEKLHLILGGAGPEEPLIRQLIFELKLEFLVELPGWVTKEQVNEYYKQADIFILPRWRPELSSMILVEAMSFGLPIILPKGGSLQWVAGHAGLYFENDNPDDLAEKIDLLISDYQLRAKLSQACYERLNDDELNHEKNIFKISQAMLKYTSSS